jgi:hypothetical protein
MAAMAEKFVAWLTTRRVSARTRATHAERAGRFLGWLDAGAALVEGDPLADSGAFTAAARDWRAYLLTVAKAAPATGERLSGRAGGTTAITALARLLEADPLTAAGEVAGETGPCVTGPAGRL